MSNAMHILVVEDEHTIATVLGEYLEQAGYRVSLLHNGMDVMLFVKQHVPDLVVLDLMLPGCDGLSLYQTLRQTFTMPVIMATARVSEDERLTGLEMGADDYICKPYSPREVVVRVRNVLRRIHQGGVGAGMQPEPLTLDQDSLRAQLYGMAVELTPSEFRLLAQLHARAGQVFDRARLLDCLRDDNWDVTDRAVDSHIKNLRRKLQRSLEQAQAQGHPVAVNEHGRLQSPIRSVYGVGYRFEW